ncbi:transcriptional regulator GcvA [Aurantivibrio infirmus]
MSQSLPPLNALRVFEACARLHSFKKASEELFVTPSAVSQQIKTLEDHLGVILFNRTASGITVTFEGKKLLPTLEKAFSDVGKIIAELKQDDRKPLRISAPPAIASGWLASRLTKFEVDNPDIVTNLHSSLESIDFSTDSIDCVIRVFFEEQMEEAFKLLDKNKLRKQFLMDSELYCVCNPNLLKDKNGVIRVPETLNDLGGFNLLHFRDYTTWTIKALSYGVEELNTTRGIVCNSVESLCGSVREGQGIALVDPMIFNSPKHQTYMVKLFEDRPKKHMSDKTYYYFIAPESSWDDDPIKKMREYIQKETGSILGHYAFEHPSS